jgi:maltose alpha-D-glucosyltransferase/alpha-amylase
VKVKPMTTQNTEVATMLLEAIPRVPFTWLRERRWFSSKGESLKSLSVADWGSLPLAEPGIMALVVARYASERTEQYLLPLIAGTSADIREMQMPSALVVNDSGTTWHLHDAFQFESFQRLLIELLIGGGKLPLHNGELVFAPEESLRQSPLPLEWMRLVATEQSNTSVIYDDRAILKCFRRVVPGLNPDVEMSRFLTTRAGFTHTPAMLGSITYRPVDGVEHSVGLLQAFVPNRGDAWEHVLVQLQAFLEAARGVNLASSNEIQDETRRLAAAQLSEIQQLGVLTGELHLALASDERDPDFAPRSLLPDHVAEWQKTIRTQSEAILTDLAARVARLPAEQQESVALLLAARSRIARRIDDLDALGRAGIKIIRYHGDYHLGQVLVGESGFLIVDFEGEPLRSLAERRAHHCPLKDVAGMMRSLSYAAQTSLIRAEDAMNGDEASTAGLGLNDWVNAWEECARKAFLTGYLQSTHGAVFLPTEAGLLRTALAVFELEKALYELKYELNNRPGWLLIPLRGIQRTL